MIIIVISKQSYPEMIRIKNLHCSQFVPSRRKPKNETMRTRRALRARSHLKDSYAYRGLTPLWGQLRVEAHGFTSGIEKTEQLQQ